MNLYRSLFHRLILRHWWEDRLQVVLLLLILGLGVGTYFSVRLANRAAVGGFEQFHSALQPSSDWVIRGANQRLRTDDLVRLRRALDPEPVVLIPVLETTAYLTRNSESGRNLPVSQAFRVIGVDLVQVSQMDRLSLSEQVSANREHSGNPPSDPAVLLEPGNIWITTPLAESLNIQAGETRSWIIGEQRVPLKVAGVLPMDAAGGTLPDFLILMDLQALQEVLDRIGSFDRVEVRFEEGPTREERMERARDRIADLGLRVEENGADQGAGESMTAAFRLNLTILSLIALLVALYLILQALDASVVRRRSEIATLRSLGFTKAMIRRVWLVEIAALGCAGGMLGLLFGWGLAQVTAGAVAQTVNALYFAVHPPSGVRPDGWDLALALALGLGGSLLAGWIPLRDAAATPPAQILQARGYTAGFGIFRRPRIGGAVVLGGCLAALCPPVPMAGGSYFPLGGYAAAFAWLIGGTLLMGGGFRLAKWLLERLPLDVLSLRLATSRLREPSSRHRLAVAGLFIAVTMAASMSILVGSFSRTMEGWIAVRFNADVYGSSSGLQGAGSDNRIREETWRRLEALEGVEAFNPYASTPIILREKRTFLAGMRFDVADQHGRMLWLAPPVAQRDPETHAAWANEAFTHRFGVQPGDVVELPIGRQVHRLQLLGVFADYGNEQGTLAVEHTTFMEWTGDGEIINFGIDLTEGHDALGWIERHAETFPGIHFRSNENLRSTILRIFRQTFAITEALKGIGLIVALIGLALAQWNLLRESRRELITLRTLGMTKGGVGRSTAMECACLGGIGYAGGVVLSLALGALLIFVINRQSFGWTLLYALPVQELILLGGATLALSTLIGYGVGYHSARIINLGSNPS
jgi:putative ABC transport system permease protein